jgi:hypothetical protein
MWYAHIIEYNSAFKKKKILKHSTVYMTLEDITLSETSQSEEDNGVTPLI